MPMFAPVAGGVGMDPPASDFNARMHHAVKDRVGPQRYELWFPNRVRFEAGPPVMVGAANLILQNFVQRSFGEAIRAAAQQFGAPGDILFRIDPALSPPSPTRPPESLPEAKGLPPERDLFTGAKEGPVKPRGEKPVDAAPERAEPPKRRWRHLHDFVVGACNRVAHAAAASVIDDAGQGPNPLVIHGPVGTGKSHLLEGIYAGLRRKQPGLRVLFVTAEDFTNRCVTAIRFGKQASFRKHFRGGDVLILDDLHFLAKKKATQQEFLNTFDALLGDGKQVVVSCDCHPRMNDDYMPELADRLLGGAIWGLQPPDGDTRKALLRSKCGSARIGEDVIDFLAERLRGNVRELEGALHSLKHFARVTGKSIDRDLAAEALGDLLRHAVRVVRVEDVDAAVCGMLRLASGALQGKERSWSVSHPRMLAVYLSRKHTAASYGEISKHFGAKGHSSAVAAEKKVRAWLEANAAITAGGREWPARELIERLERALLG